MTVISAIQPGGHFIWSMTAVSIQYRRAGAAVPPRPAAATAAVSPAAVFPAEDSAAVAAADGNAPQKKKGL